MFLVVAWDGADLDLIEPELAQLPVDTTSLLDRQQAFGYTQEDVQFLVFVEVKELGLVSVCEGSSKRRGSKR